MTERSGAANGSTGAGDPEDLAAEPDLSGSVGVEQQPIELPVAVFGMLGEQLAGGATRRSTRQQQVVELVLRRA